MVKFSFLLIPKERLEETPSRRDGVAQELEESLRAYGCALVQRAAIFLRLKAVTVACATVLLHRFYFRRSLREFDVRFVAAAALYLACKLQEDARRVRDIILVFTFVHWKEAQQTSPDVDPPETLAADSEEFLKIKNTIHRVERYILRETGFLASQTMVHPHPHILKFVDALFSKVNCVDPQDIAQRAWGYINDSYRTTLCCEVEPPVIAAASIYLAACDANVPLPKELRWYELFEVSWDKVMQTVDRIRKLYDAPPPKYVRLHKHRNEATAAAKANDVDVAAAAKADDVAATAVASAADGSGTGPEAQGSKGGSVGSGNADLNPEAKESRAVDEKSAAAVVASRSARVTEKEDVEMEDGAGMLEISPAFSLSPSPPESAAETATEATIRSTSIHSQ